MTRHPRRRVRRGRTSPRSVRIPSAHVRRTRGPSPPDHVLVPLVAYLEGRDARTDAHGFPPLARRWRTLLGQAFDALVRHARRGVVRALGAARRALAQGAPPPPPEDWVARVTEAVRGAIRPGNEVSDVRRSVRAAVGVLGRLILAEHSRLVRQIALAAGVSFYIWTSRRDGLVRVLHAALDGRVFSWSNPPVSGTHGWRGHPGQPAECRCTPFPLDPDIYGAILSV